MKNFVKAVAKIWTVEGGKKAFAKYIGGIVIWGLGVGLMLDGYGDMDAAIISDYLGHDLDEEQRKAMIELYSNPEYGKR